MKNPKELLAVTVIAVFWGSGCGLLAEGLGGYGGMNYFSDEPQKTSLKREISDLHVYYTKDYPLGIIHIFIPPPQIMYKTTFILRGFVNEDEHAITSAELAARKIAKNGNSLTVTVQRVGIPPSLTMVEILSYSKDSASEDIKIVLDEIKKNLSLSFSRSSEKNYLTNFRAHPQ